MNFKSKREEKCYGLTRREIEVITLLAEGKTYAEVATDLFISIETVRRHATNIYAKLNVENRMRAVRKYFG